MKMKGLIAAALTVGLSGTALAADDSKTPDASTEKRICRTETVTGSLIARRRICMTKAEWDQVEAANKQNVDKFASQQTQRPGDQSNPLSPH